MDARVGWIKTIINVLRVAQVSVWVDAGLVTEADYMQAFAETTSLRPMREPLRNTAPAVQYGDWAIVKKRMRSIATRIKRGESIVGVMTEDGVLDVGAHSGLMMMGGLVLAGGRDFHCFLPWQPLWQDPPKDLGVMDAIFQESLSVSWGVLGLLAFENKPWFYANEERFEPFLAAAIRVWYELDAVGPRYFDGVQGQSLWTLPGSLHYVLANMGVPQDLLRAPLPPEGPRALLKYVRQAIHV